MFSLESDTGAGRTAGTAGLSHFPRESPEERAKW
jgi:hypothetical protein